MVEDLLWQVLVLQLRVFREADELVGEHGRESVEPLIRALNEIDEHVFGALFALAPEMYEESDSDARAREERARARFGDLPDSLDLSGSSADRLLRLLDEIRRRLGMATIELDVADDGDDVMEALVEVEDALQAVSASRALLGELG